MPELQNEQFQKRQVAYKISIATILNSAFAKDETSAGYIKVNDLVISRANIIGILVSKNEAQNSSSAIIDDGTGRINLRTFEPSNVFSRAEIGDSVIVVGKIREYNDEKYIIPEIIRKIDSRWVNVRRNEIGNSQAAVAENSDKTEEIIIVQSPKDNIYSIIKELDKGDGVLIDDIIKMSKSNDTESVVKTLLKSGDIFEVKPGMLKVLE